MRIVGVYDVPLYSLHDTERIRENSPQQECHQETIFSDSSTKFVTGGAWALRKSAMLKAEKPTDNRPMKSHKASIPDMLDGIGARNNPEVVLKGGKGNLIGQSRS
jgi:hypothetical protein